MNDLTQALRKRLAVELKAYVGSDEYKYIEDVWGDGGLISFGKGIQSEVARLEPLHELLLGVVEAAERYEHIPLANDERNASSAPSNQYSPIAGALAALREAVLCPVSTSEN